MFVNNRQITDNKRHVLVPENKKKCSKPVENGYRRSENITASDALKSSVKKSCFLFFFKYKSNEKLNSQNNLCKTQIAEKRNYLDHSWIKIKCSILFDQFIIPPAHDIRLLLILF